jgi:hypothetical protein
MKPEFVEKFRERDAAKRHHEKVVVELMVMQFGCKHEWRTPVYDPIPLPHDPDDMWGASEIPRWWRTCKHCGTQIDLDQKGFDALTVK